jgi:rubrerythrin
MSDKPSYLGTLNRIALAEAGGERFLSAWAEVCKRDDVRAVIETIALREGEHAKAFAKRMCELGYGLRKHEDPRFAERMEIASSTALSDRQKFEKLGLVGLDGAKEILGRMFDDTTIDPQTGALLGRFIAEERDSLRMFQACYEALRAEEANGGDGDRAEAIAAIERRLERIETAVGKISRALDGRRGK